MSLVIDRGGTSLDHIALGVPDTKEGAVQIAELIGFEPYLSEPEPDQFYWSGSVPLGSGRFLEILGPNPAHKKFNPFIEMVKRLEEPSLLFWYVATNDFQAFETAAKATGAPMERVETVKYERDGILTDYTRGYLGPGFRSVSPNVIEWRARNDRLDDSEGIAFVNLELSHPDADQLNKAFDALGIPQDVRSGPHTMRLKLGTPNGPVEFSNEGFEFLELRAIGTVVSLYAR